MQFSKSHQATWLRSGVVMCVVMGVLTGVVGAQATRPIEKRLPGLKPAGGILLPNGWTLRPAGRQLGLGHFPVNLAVHPSSEWSVVLHAGMTDHELGVIHNTDRTITSRVTVPQAFYGVCFSPDGSRLFASGAEFEVVHSFKFEQGLLSDPQKLRIADEKETFIPGGLSAAADGSALYVAGTFGHAIAIVPLSGDAAAHAEPRRIAMPPRSFPYTVVADEGGGRLFVSRWGASGVAVVDPVKANVTAVWPTQAHPTEMALSPDRRTLYVACANSTSVSVLDTADGKSLETIVCSLHPSAPPGNTPVSLALDADGHTLYVANANANNVALIDV